MKNKIICAIAAISFAATSLIAIETHSLDEGFAEITTKNNKVNILNFPFLIKDAKVVSATAESFSANNQGKSIVLTPTTIYKTEKADLLITSREGDTYVIELKAENKAKTERIFNFTSNKAQKSTASQQVYETGKIDKDISKLLKKAMLGEKISGYKMLEVKRQFNTPDLLMQKEYILDGGKYRVEKWFVQNKSTTDEIAFEESNFYTNGILGIAFEDDHIDPKQTTVMWLIINKASLAE